MHGGFAAEQVAAFLQMQQRGGLAVVVFGDEHVTAGRLVQQMPTQIAPQMRQGFLVFAPGRQVKGQQALGQTQDESFVAGFGEAEVQLRGGVAHARCGRDGGGVSWEPI